MLEVWEGWWCVSPPIPQRGGLEARRGAKRKRGKREVCRLGSVLRLFQKEVSVLRLSPPVLGAWFLRRFESSARQPMLPIPCREAQTPNSPQGEPLLRRLRKVKIRHLTRSLGSARRSCGLCPSRSCWRPLRQFFRPTCFGVPSSIRSRSVSSPPLPSPFPSPCFFFFVFPPRSLPLRAFARCFRVASQSRKSETGAGV